VPGISGPERRIEQAREKLVGSAKKLLARKEMVERPINRP
jgi:hypothetical protein